MIFILAGIVASFLIYLSLELLEDLLEDTKNKSILILGPNAAGKTTLLKFLTENKIIKQYIKSPITEKGNLKSIQINNSKITTAITMPGDELIIKAWVEEIHKHDYVIYLISLKKIVNNSLEIGKDECGELPIDKIEQYKERVKSDLRRIREELKKQQSSKTFILGFNFADCFPLYFNDKDIFEQKIQKFIYEYIITAGGANSVKYVIGSLCDEKWQEDS